MHILSHKESLFNPKGTIIEDNGKGILASAQQRIFVPFYSTRPNGSGIGLSLSRLIMQLHNGTISVQSELGKGSCFTLVF